MKKLLTAMALSSMIVACGGVSDSSSKKTSGETNGVGTYSGSTNDAQISNANKEALAQTAAFGAKEAIDGEEQPSLPVGGALIKDDLQSRLDEIVRGLQQLPSGAEAQPDNICSSGSVSINGDENNFKIVFNQCDTGTMIINGTIISTNSGGKDTTVFDATVTDKSTNEVINIKYTEVCDVDSEGYLGNCSSVTDFKDADGNSYRVESSYVTGNSSQGYTVQAKVYNSEYGAISISSTNLLYDCSNGYPSSGSIVYSSGSESATVTFNSCTEFTIEYDGVSSTHSW